ncbi:amidohydrolase family protein [Mycobacteroides saopaulense]|uniref:amidohydrolase family protein n=1 Tax=Mycobacteroides saopaulense TaxID=1578165 RepID=UPI001A9643AB|nr:amidohydrolase family protein [Mycobacteroides saopaulense]
MRIDIHAHLWSDDYLALLDGYGRAGTDVHRRLGAGATREDLDGRFTLMDEAGVDLQVLTATPASPHFEDEAAATESARFVNDEYARLASEYPGRFRALASLPLPHIPAALEELARAIDDLGMYGAAITTSVLGRSIADPIFDPVYEELNRRGAVLFVHPAGCGAESSLITDHSLTWSIGAPIEDTVAIMHLIVAGIPSRYPDMKIVTCHLGGALPMVLERAHRQVTEWEATHCPEAPKDAARRIWYDTVGHDHTPALQAAVASLGADRLVFGSDFPYQGGPRYVSSATYIQEGLSADEASLILDRNGAQLLGLTDRGTGRNADHS